MRISSILFILFIWIPGAQADSPLTSTPFHSAYSEHKMVAHAMEVQTLDKKIIKFLLKKKADPVIKLAIINALGWGNKYLVGQFEAALMKKRKGLEEGFFDELIVFPEDAPEDNEQTLLLTADDLMCWAYLKAMGDYFNPRDAMKAAFLGYQRDEKSMVHGTALALIASQTAFDADWCSVYQVAHQFIEVEEYDENELSEEGVGVIMKYISLYKDDCE